MSERNKIIAETQRWLLYAERDLDAAKLLACSESNFAQQVCFFCQQAAEKSLKGALIFLQLEFPFRHDLELLRTYFPQDWQCSRLSNLEELTEWAVESRYPSALKEASTTDAELALQQAEMILGVVKHDLAQQGFPV